MKITFDWLKDHLKTGLKEKNLLDQLTNIGLEVESVENLSAENELFKVVKIIKTEKHPNADRLKVCDVDIGNKNIKKVVCGASNEFGFIYCRFVLFSLLFFWSNVERKKISKNIWEKVFRVPTKSPLLSAIHFSPFGIFHAKLIFNERVEKDLRHDKILKA